jgi:hypothetical protein
MSLNLTSEERKYAEALAKTSTKYNHFSKKMRLPVLIFALILLALNIYRIFALLNEQKEPGKRYLVKHVSSTEGISSSISSKSSMELIAEKIVYKEIKYHREFERLMFFHFMITLFLVLIIINWKRYLHDSIYAKILREKLDEEKSTKSNDEIIKEHGQ